ncbi:MAG: adenylate/guanylate cyclase domain-containing protein [Porticoccaceae bacterium]|nr:MAG: adenylate/guanylate cyclase domain-containing protein [Porticoccaceae bacterium]
MSLQRALLGVAAAVGAALAAVLLGRTTTLLAFVDDARALRLAAEAPGTAVWFVDIDEASLARLGPWPWPRARLARLIEAILRQGVAAVGVDVILADDGDVAGSRLLARLDRERLVWAVAPSGPGEAAVRRGRLPGAPPCPPDHPWGAPARGFLGLAETIADDQPFRAGHIRPEPDGDGRVRTYLPFVEVDGRCLPALGLALYGALLGIPPEAPIEREGGTYRWGGIALGLEPDGRLRLLWRLSALGSVSAAALLAGEATLPAGAVVLVGSTALGTGDVVATPAAKRFTGAGVHALALGQWLDRAFLVRPAWHDPLVAALLATFLLACWPLSARHAAAPWLAWGALAAGWFAAAQFAARVGLWLEVAPFLWVLPALPALQGLRLWQQHGERRLLERQFEAYLPEKVLRQLIETRADPHRLAAEAREVSVLFADLRGFTSLSETLPPERVVELLNLVMDQLAEEVARFDGTLDKFLGDGLMAFWGAPVPMADHADRAVACAQAMLDGLPRLNRRLVERGMPAVDLTIGIDSGTVAVGHLGSRSRKNYTAVGDVVNVAARLQQRCGDLGVRLLVSERAARACRRVSLVALCAVSLKGKREPVAVFTAG